MMRFDPLGLVGSIIKDEKGQMLLSGFIHSPPLMDTLHLCDQIASAA
jgi:hypothetical protein